MQAFLEKTATYIFEKYPHDIGQLCIVLPNRRAALFLKKHLAKKAKTAMWSPEIFSIEDFIINLSGFQLLDSVDLLFEFYQVYLQHTKTEIQPFEDFSKWALTLINDFSETDSYLTDGKQLFSNLSNIKNIENWSLSNEDLTELQRAYLKWWDLLGVYYHAFSERLMSKNMAYQGMAYRKVATDISEKELLWKRIIFAGFNALNTAEEKIIKLLLQKNTADVLWDADSYYLNNHQQEAGKFIRKYQNSFSISAKDFLWEEHILSTDKKNITVIGAAKNITQAKIAGDILTELNQEDIEKTALVLANEELLLPVLHSLPENIDTVNITMGFPLNKTPVADFFDLILALHEKAKTTAKGKKLFYHKDLVKLTQHPYSHYLFSSILLNEIAHFTISKNKIFISLENLEKELKNWESENIFLFTNILGEWSGNLKTIDAVLLLLLSLNEALLSHHGDSKSKSPLDYEYLLAYSKIIFRIQALSNNYNCIDTIKSLRQIFNMLIRSSSLPFYGEPLQGLQIMGMLETRTLDFENVILLSANENTLPENKSKNSFIPFDLKKAFGLPTYNDQDAIYAYHFYRLIQRAKNIYIVYNTENDGLGKGEKSRFVMQLLHELPKVNPNIKIEEKIINSKIITDSGNKEINIEKTKDILDKIDQKAVKGFSPSLLNTYKNCSLQFYFQYVAGLKEAEEVQEIIGADVLGNAIHKVLEKLYLPFVGKQLTSNDVEQMKKLVEDKIQKAFEEEYGKDDLKYGKNLLTVKIAEKFIQQFLSFEQKNVDKNVLIIESLEREFSAPLHLSILGKGDIEITLKGKIDRIDLAKNTVRIIDYKTGAVADKELKINAWDELLINADLNKSFQLLMYAYLYRKQTGENKKPIQSGIVSFRKLSGRVKNILVNGSDILTEVILNDFEKQLKKLIEEIYNTNVPFSQSNDVKRCEYCSFRLICNR